MTRETAQTALRAFKESLVRAFGPETEVTLFGSTARGDYGADSDIDVLVLLPFHPIRQPKKESSTSPTI